MYDDIGPMAITLIFTLFSQLKTKLTKHWQRRCETVSPLAIKHYVIKQSTILAMRNVNSESVT